MPVEQWFQRQPNKSTTSRPARLWLDLDLSRQRTVQLRAAQSHLQNYSTDLDRREILLLVWWAYSRANGWPSSNFTVFASGSYRCVLFLQFLCERSVLCVGQFLILGSLKEGGTEQPFRPVHTSRGILSSMAFTELMFDVWAPTPTSQDSTLLGAKALLPR